MRSVTPTSPAVRDLWCLLVLMAASTSSAAAPSFSATARAGNQNASVGFQDASKSGSGPVQAVAARAAAGNSAVATGTSARGRVAASSDSKSVRDRFVGSSSAFAFYDEIVFSWAGDGAQPSNTSIDVGLNYNFSFEESGEGPMPRIKGQNYRTAKYQVVIGPPSLFGQRGIGGIDADAGDAEPVTTGVGDRTLDVTVPLERPISVTLLLEVGTSALTTQLNQPASTSVTAALQVSSMSGSGPANAPSGARSFVAQSGPLPSPVFALPEGYTVNSVSMGVVDNAWVAGQVPEPGTWAMLLAGLGLLWGLSGRRTHAFGPRTAAMVA